jgi:hypothetical protein
VHRAVTTCSAARGLFNHTTLTTYHLTWPSHSFPGHTLPPRLSSSHPSSVLSYAPLARACPHSSHLQPSLPWIIRASAHLARIDHLIPNIPNHLWLQLLPLPTSINPQPLIVHSIAPLISKTLVTAPTMCLFKVPKEETGELRSINPAEYDNTLLTRMFCPRRLVPTLNLVSQWWMPRSSVERKA